jgi:probable rRNA maturation factor
MMPIWTVDVAVEEGELPADLLGDLESAVRATLAAESAGDAEISVALVSDAAISRLNREYLSHDGPTDVISFALEAHPGGAGGGDIYIGLGQAERQAREEGVSTREELLRLAIHGTLHVLGWDHPEEDDGRAESEMYRRQEAILSGLLARDVGE